MFPRNILARMPRAALAERSQQPISRARLDCHVLSALLRRAILDSRVSPQRIAPMSRDRALVVGPLGAEGPRGHGMATPWATWTDPTPLISNNPCEKSI